MLNTAGKKKDECVVRSEQNGPDVGREKRMTIRMMVIMMMIMIMVMIMTVSVIRKHDGSYQLMHVCACCLYDGVILYMYLQY